MTIIISPPPRTIQDIVTEVGEMKTEFETKVVDTMAGKLSEADLLAAAAEFREEYLAKSLEAVNVMEEAGTPPVEVAQETIPEIIEPTPIVPVVEEVPNIEQILFTDDVKVGEKRNIINIKVPKEMENNVDTGYDKINILMAGDGATPSTACLVTGVPGAGKSTLMFQLADSITKTGNVALYNTCEESLVQVSRVAKRLRLKHGFNVSSHRSVFDLIEHAKILQADNPGKQVFLFVDSLQTVEVPNFRYDENCAIIRDKNGEPVKRQGRPSSGQTTQVEATQILTTWCKKTYGIMFLIGQVNKDGDFAGRQAIKHWIDAHLHLDINKDRYSPDHGSRTCEMTKNRFGVAGIYYPFELEARGVRFTEPKKTGH